MAQQFAERFYRSPAWRKNRANYMNALLDTSGNVLLSEYRDGRLVYFRRDDPLRIPVSESSVIPSGMCERCFLLGKYELAKVVHHKIHLTPMNINDPKVTLAYENLQRLCQDCHAFVHSGQTESRVVFDEKGNVSGPSAADDFRAQMMALTDAVGERRNIHKEAR